MVAGTYNTSYSGGWGRRITQTQEAEVAVSRDHTIALQPRQQSKTSCQKKRRQKRETQWRGRKKKLKSSHISNFLFESNIYTAGHSGSHLDSQHFGRLRWVDHDVRSSRPAWPTWWNPISTKNTKISWVWWRVPVIPATQEAEEGEWLEPRRRRLWWAKIMPLHSSLGNNSETPSQKKKKGKRKKMNVCYSQWVWILKMNAKFY